MYNIPERYYSKMQKKKALIVSESTVYKDKSRNFFSRGGGETCIHNLAKSLVFLEIETEVLGIQEYKNQKNEEIIDNVFYKRLPVRSRSSFMLFKYLKFAVCESRKFDYIFLNQFVPHLILPFIKSKKFPIIHDVYSGNGPLFWIKNYGFFRGLMGIFVEKLQLFLDAGYSDKIFTVSKSSKNKILNSIGIQHENKIVVNPFPIDENNYPLHQKKEDYLLYVGRFVDYKNPCHVLYVLKKVLAVYPDFKAVFVVPRVDRALLKMFYRIAGDIDVSKNIKIMNCVSADRMKELFAKAKILIQPSYVEGQGIAVLESLISGTPVVAYHLDAYEGMLISGKNSVLAEKGNMESLINGCLKILQNYRYFQKNCKITLDGFSPGLFLNKLNELLKNQFL